MKSKAFYVLSSIEAISWILAVSAASIINGTTSAGVTGSNTNDGKNEEVQDLSSGGFQNEQVTSSTTVICEHDPIAANPFIHKSHYTIGVHATRGLDEAFNETHTLFSEYLSATAGQMFEPPIKFELVPYYFDGVFTAIENNEMDFLYANPGIYSCIGTQIGATALATVVKALEVRGQPFELDVYGGVIATRHDNDEINSVTDLKDKIIGAGAIVDLMGGQMQIYEMEKAGMSYVNDPMQVVFTKDQTHVVRGILNGRFDAGFIRTDQIELTTDENGVQFDPDLFKIIQPKIYVMDSGELFPFLHSTDIFPEWPFAALPHVPQDVQTAVQNALMTFDKYAHVGKLLKDCPAQNTAQFCNSQSPQDLFQDAPCDTTIALAMLALEASHTSHTSGFRTASSYFSIRSVQQDAGFLVQDDRKNWYCTRPANLFEGITCPKGYFKRREQEFLEGCGVADLDCDDNDEYDCFCKPCVKAFDVDVYHHSSGENDPHMHAFFGESLPGCHKMSICASVEQGDDLVLRIYDNLERPDANVTVISHAGDQKRDLPVVNLEDPFAYEFVVHDKEVQVQVIEILVNGAPISQSPIRVMIETKNCDAVYGTGSNRVSDSQGVCICPSNTYEMADTCLKSSSFFLIVSSAVFIALAIMTSTYLGYKKQQSDSVWHVSADELHFNEPPEIIGQGAFGVVILGQYRGTKVAVKRVLPPKKALRGHSSTSIASGDVVGVTVTSAEVPNRSPTRILTTTKGKAKNSQRKKIVQFGNSNPSEDIESQSFSKDIEKRGSLGASSGNWERLLMMHHSDNDILKILESATGSDHSSGELLKYSASASRSHRLLRFLPMWLRFDEHSRRINDFIVEMRLLSRLRHPCITTVMGAVVSPTVDPMLVMEFMEYGSLHDLLHNATMTLSGEIILQVVRDIVQGIQFLHASKPPILHGDLKAKNILVDCRFRAKVADFGFSHFKTAKQRNILQGTPFYMAPEYLRRHTEYTTACDIYSFAMIIFEIYGRASPFEGEDPRKILPKVCHPRLNKRPPIPDCCPPRMVELMKKCWSSNAFFRPSAKDVDYVLVEMSSKDTEPLDAGNGFGSEGLKRKAKSLYDVFPGHIADALSAGKKVEAESHEIVTIVFSEIVGLSSIAENLSAMHVASLLERIYKAFDVVAKKHNIFKVETVGDAYMGVTNLDGREYGTHVKQVAEYAQDAIRVASKTVIDERNPSTGYLQIRVGFHSGPVVSNVIGTINPRYGLFGDTVNTATRMATNSLPGRVHCSYASAQLLKTQVPEMPLALRGKIHVKGKGKMKTFWVGAGVHSDSDNENCANSLPLETQRHESSGSDDDVAQTSGEQKDHFIHVHCIDDPNNHNAHVQMDGTVTVVNHSDHFPDIQHLYES